MKHEYIRPDRSDAVHKRGLCRRMVSVWLGVCLSRSCNRALWRNGYRYGHSCYGMIIGNRTQAFEWYYIQHPWVTSSDLAKYSMTQNIARPLCDSWASCYRHVDFCLIWPKVYGMILLSIYLESFVTIAWAFSRNSTDKVGCKQT